MGRGGENETRLGREELEFFQLKREFGFLFRAFVFGDGFAEGTGVLAVERALKRRGKGGGPEILGQHGGPGQGLQKAPVPAD